MSHKQYMKFNVKFKSFKFTYPVDLMIRLFGMLVIIATNQYYNVNASHFKQNIRADDKSFYRLDFTSKIKNFGDLKPICDYRVVNELSVLDCSKKNLSNISHIPYDAHIINLNSNRLTEIGLEFQNLTRSIKIDLSFNEIRHINEQAFRNCHNLEELKLQHNKLQDFPVFPNINSIRHLFLQHNQIRELAPISLKPLEQLITLDLGYNEIRNLIPDTFTSTNSRLRRLFLNNNSIYQLFSRYFDNLVLLEWLKLSKNKLRQLPDSLFGNLTHLKYLELNRNKFTVIPSLAFRELTNLQVLKLKRNRLKVLRDGAFWGLSHIQYLQLDYNDIISIHRQWLYGLRSLEKLSLTHNSIVNLDIEQWDTLPNLKELDLSYNQLNRIPSHVFYHTPELEIVSLSHNNISIIDLQAFAGSRHVKSIDLSFNNINNALNQYDPMFASNPKIDRYNIDSDMITYNLSPSLTNPFCFLTGTLKTLNLKSNGIYGISLSATTNLCLLDFIARLTKLDVTQNDIQKIATDRNQTNQPFENYQNLPELLINTSSLNCNCDTYRLNEMFHLFSRRMAIIDPQSNYVKCNYPPVLNGINLFDKHTSYLTAVTDKLCQNGKFLPNYTTDIKFFIKDDVVMDQSVSDTIHQTTDSTANETLHPISRSQIALDQVIIPKLPIELIKYPSSREEFVQGTKSQTLTCIATLNFITFYRLPNPTNFTTKLILTDREHLFKRILDVKWQKENEMINDVNSVNVNVALPVKSVKSARSPLTTTHKIHENIEVRQNYSLSLLATGTIDKKEKIYRKRSNEKFDQFYEYSLTLASKLVFTPFILSDIHEGIYQCIAQTKLNAGSGLRGMPNAPLINKILYLPSNYPVEKSVSSPQIKVAVLVAPYFIHNVNIYPPYQDKSRFDRFNNLDDKTKISETNSPNLNSPTNSDDENVAYLAVKIGGLARLDCIADGNPRPRVAWQKVKLHRDSSSRNVIYEIADFPAARERRMRVMDPSTADSAFYITNVQMSDAGSYLCKARNRVGMAKHRLELKVLQVPSFVKRLRDLAFINGSTGRLDCLVMGSPEPSITWFKDGNFIEANKYRKTQSRKHPSNKPRTYLTNGGKTLILSFLSSQDSGTYECVVQNTLGKISSVAKIKVYSGQMPNNYTMDDEYFQGDDGLPDMLNQVISYDSTNHNPNYVNAMPSVPTKRKSFYEEDTDVKHIREFLESEDSFELSQPKNAMKIYTNSFERLRYEKDALNYAKIVKTTTGNLNGSSSAIMIEIVVLAVVSCAVVTSIIWVLVIYSARRRRFKRIFGSSSNPFRSPKKFIMLTPDPDESGHQPNYYKQQMETAVESSVPNVKTKNNHVIVKLSSDGATPENIKLLSSRGLIIHHSDERLNESSATLCKWISKHLYHQIRDGDSRCKAPNQKSYWALSRLLPHKKLFSKPPSCDSSNFWSDFEPKSKCPGNCESSKKHPAVFSFFKKDAKKLQKSMAVISSNEYQCLNMIRSQFYKSNAPNVSHRSSGKTADCFTSIKDKTASTSINSHPNHESVNYLVSPICLFKTFKQYPNTSNTDNNKTRLKGGANLSNTSIVGLNEKYFSNRQNYFPPFRIGGSLKDLNEISKTESPVLSSAQFRFSAVARDQLCSESDQRSWKNSDKIFKSISSRSLIYEYNREPLSEECDSGLAVAQSFSNQSIGSWPNNCHDHANLVPLIDILKGQYDMPRPIVDS